MRRIGLAVVLALSFILAPPAGGAQQAPRTYRIGFLGTTSRQDQTSPLAGFRQGLLDLGYVEGRNFLIEYRWADDKYERLPALAAELVRSGVDVIVVYGTPGSLAAQKATTTIPIVMVAGDPVRSGLVASLARPGGNITGLSIQDFELIIKRLELLKEVVPTASRVAYLQVPGTQPPDVAESLQRQEDSAARSMGLQLQRVMVRGVSDFAGAFSTMAKNGAQALTVANVAPLGTHAGEIAALATQYRLPAIGGQKGMARTGLLLTYGPDLSDLQRSSAAYVDKILKGAKPSDLPVEQPTKFELVINMKTAKALGLALPQSLLLRADQVIE
jgi:putative ABC transport system substrate-binding protein